MYTGLHVKNSSSCQILMKLDFFDRSSKSTQISNFMKIRAVGAHFFHADGRTDTDMTKLTATFSNFGNEPTK